MTITDTFQSDHDQILAQMLRVSEAAVVERDYEHACRAVEAALSLMINTGVVEQAIADKAAAAKKEASSPRKGIAGVEAE